VNAADVEGEAACCSAAVAVAGEAALTVAPLPAEVFTSDTGTMEMELAETAALPLLPVVVAAAPAESVPVAEPEADTLLALLVADEPEESVEDAPAESVEDDPESVEDDVSDEDDPEPSFEDPDDVEVVVVVELLEELLLVPFAFMVKVQVVTS